jgi:Oxidoreductase family, NAD-binding Rossmann fold
MKVSVIGAGRNRNGIGRYIAKYFHKNGAAVVSVLGTTQAKASNAAVFLQRYGIKASAYTDFAEMIKSERPDAVAIASPYLTHYEYIIKSIKAGLHLFCEKPFLWAEQEDMSGMIEEIFKIAEQKSLKIAVNSQWPFSISAYEKLCGQIDVMNVESFFITLSPVGVGKEMILEAVPHALSLLFSVFGSGDIEGIKTEFNNNKIKIIFSYISSNNTCNVLINLVTESRQPRTFLYGFDNKVVNRIIDLETYDIAFEYANKTIKIDDPLESSVKNFIQSVKTDREPLIGKPHIVNNAYLLKKIWKN